MDNTFPKRKREIILQWLPWLLTTLVLLAALLHEFLQFPILRSLSSWGQALVWSGALLGIAALYGLSIYSNRLNQQRQILEQRTRTAERRADEAQRRLSAIFRISQKYVEASDENEIIQLVLQLAVDLVGATGASYVPLDEHGQPSTAISQGELPFPVINDWVEYLATPAVRNRCRACEHHGALNPDRSCPLLKGPFADAIGLFCLPLRRGEREFGVLNLFMPNMERLDAEAQGFLRALIDETALALEGVRLRRRELAALRQLQAVREKKDFNALLQTLLDDVRETIEADFAQIQLCGQPDREEQKLYSGSFPSSAQPFLDGVLQGVMASSEPVLLGKVAGDSTTGPGVSSLIAAPLLDANRTALGALLIGNRREELFHPRQLSLLQTVTGQVALIVQNANLMEELEYKVIIQERTRLAREIHDGLAQTLGFLKLQTAQMQNYLMRNEMDRLRQSADLCYSTLSEAYQDVRQAIDGLRIGPGESGLQGWLEQTVDEFSEMSGLPVSLEKVQIGTQLPPEVHAQLIRIVQEALSNIRKHAQASQVWISCQEYDEALWLEVRDDGRGFSPEDVPGRSQHGLRGMSERADLIGADFQVISRDEQGTTVRVRMPLTSVRSL